MKKKKKKKQLKENSPEEAQTLYLRGQEFKTTTLNLFKKSNKACLENKQKQYGKSVSQARNITKEIKESHRKFWDLKAK